MEFNILPHYTPKRTCVRFGEIPLFPSSQLWPASLEPQENDKLYQVHHDILVPSRTNRYVKFLYRIKTQSYVHTFEFIIITTPGYFSQFSPKCTKVHTPHLGIFARDIQDQVIEFTQVYIEQTLPIVQHLFIGKP